MDLPVCSGLTKLPRGLGQLLALQQSNLSNCWALTVLPGSLGQLLALRLLKLSDCRGLTKLPGSLGQLTALQHLNLSRCWTLTSLPDSLCQLSALQHLDLSHCGVVMELQHSPAQLLALYRLSMYFGRKVTGIPGSLEKLLSLQLLNHAQPDFLLAVTSGSVRCYSTASRSFRSGGISLQGERKHWLQTPCDSTDDGTQTSTNNWHVFNRNPIMLSTVHTMLLPFKCLEVFCLDCWQTWGAWSGRWYPHMTAMSGAGIGMRLPELLAVHRHRY